MSADWARRLYHPPEPILTLNTTIADGVVREPPTMYAMRQNGFVVRARVVGVEQLGGQAGRQVAEHRMAIGRRGHVGAARVVGIVGGAFVPAPERFGSGSRHTNHDTAAVRNGKGGRPPLDKVAQRLTYDKYHEDRPRCAALGCGSSNTSSSFSSLNALSQCLRLICSWPASSSQT